MVREWGLAMAHSCGRIVGAERERRYHREVENGRGFGMTKGTSMGRNNEEKGEE
jgi:hypothetical protein